MRTNLQGGCSLTEETETSQGKSSALGGGKER